jgi:hypothetical protein
MIMQTSISIYSFESLGTFSVMCGAAEGRGYKRGSDRASGSAVGMPNLDPFPCHTLHNLYRPQLLWIYLPSSAHSATLEMGLGVEPKHGCGSISAQRYLPLLECDFVFTQILLQAHPCRSACHRTCLLQSIISRYNVRDSLYYSQTYALSITHYQVSFTCTRVNGSDSIAGRLATVFLQKTW